MSLHLLGSDDAFTIEARLVGALVGIIALILIRSARTSRLPFVAFAAVQIYVFFGAATLQEPEFRGFMGPIPLRSESLTLALVAAALSLAALGVGAIAGRRLGKRGGITFLRILPDEVGPNFDFAARVWAVMSFAIYFMIALRPSTVSGALHFALVILSHPALALTFLSVALAKSRSRSAYYWFYSYAIAVSSVGLLKGRLSEVLVPWLIVVFLSWAKSRRFPGRWVIGLTLAFVILNPAKQIFRAEVWEPTGRSSDEIGIEERLDVWIAALESTWSNGDTDDNLDTNASRLSTLPYVAQVIEWVPTQVPYTGVDRWLQIPSFYIPRILWPEKPDLRVVNNVHYTLSFGLQTTESAETTTLAFSQMADGYWALGWPGVAIVGFLIGFLIGIYEGASSVSDRWSLLAVGMLMLISTKAPNHLAVQFGGVQMLAVGVAACWIATALSYVQGPDRRLNNTDSRPPNLHERSRWRLAQKQQEEIAEKKTRAKRTIVRRSSR